MALLPTEGDIFVHASERGFVATKILKIDSIPTNGGPFITHHKLFYEPVPVMPSLADIPSLPVQIWHAPFAPEAIAEGHIHLGNLPVTEDDLQGYRVYQEMQGGAFEEEESPYDTKAALAAYNEGCASADAGREAEGLAAFTRAIELFPFFYEALDNRGLLYMDLMAFAHAKEDFEKSIQVYDGDDNPLPHVKLLLCHLELEEFDAAQQKAAECLRRWPDDPTLHKLLTPG